ncbi:hypothetical protein TURU_086110 [Turdus rufiventris]|nr:hypothetical protein TURU_086110 [Turdus rufiventris]
MFPGKWELVNLLDPGLDTAVRTAEKGWTHASRVKRIETREETPEGKVASSPGDLKKNIPAAKKMAYLTIGCNPVGVGKGREVRLWGILVSLSLVMCQPINAYPRSSTNPVEQSLSDECGECPWINPLAYPAPANCTNREKDEYCTFNGTPYARCELDGKVICYNLKVRLMHSVVQGMQTAAMPMDPELASRLGGNRTSKIMKLGEKEVKTNAVEALAKFEEKIKRDNFTYQDCQEESLEEWDSSGESEED